MMMIRSGESGEREREKKLHIFSTFPLSAATTDGFRHVHVHAEYGASWKMVAEVAEQMNEIFFCVQWKCKNIVKERAQWWKRRKRVLNVKLLFFFFRTAMLTRNIFIAAKLFALQLHCQKLKIYFFSSSSFSHHFSLPVSSFEPAKENEIWCLNVCEPFQQPFPAIPYQNISFSLISSHSIHFSSRSTPSSLLLALSLCNRERRSLQ